jgi:regulator of protease activity HflC (stomatin/prohibitin superfamily)
MEKTRFAHRLENYLVRVEPEIVEREFHLVDLGPTEIGLRYEDGVLVEALAPSTHRLYWKGYVDQRFERYDISTQAAIAPELLAQLDALTDEKRKTMMIIRKFCVNKDERALLFDRGDFVAILGPGEHIRFDPFRRLELQKFALAETRFDHRLDDWLLKVEPELVAREFHFVELGATEVGLVYEDGVLVAVLAPNTRQLYWKGYIDLRFERIDISTDFAIDAKLVPQLIACTGPGFKSLVTGGDGVFGVQVPAFHVVALYVNGKLHDVLEAGAYAFWAFGRDLRVDFVDLRLQVIEVTGQEILTKDKVPLRVNLNAGYRVTDVATAFAKQAKPADFLYRELQFGLRAAVGTRTLDELLENKGVIDQVVADHISRRVQGFGIEVDSVGVKDIILPGDMKMILARVVEADKIALANVIRRREETAATRSLLNTARVMEDNPTALRLKELETLEKVTEKIDRISVFGGLDAVLKDLVKLR